MYHDSDNIHAVNLSRSRLLRMLPQDDLHRCQPEMKLVNLARSQVLYESGEQIQHVFFPLDAIVSLLYVTRNGSCSETAVVGTEGVVGVAIFMGDKLSTNRAVVLCSGQAVRMRSAFVAEEFKRSAPVLRLMLRYVQALISQTSQTAVCNRFHSLDQQLCRWLLHSLDRLQTNVLQITQQLISEMLGVRREGVTESALKLQRDGLINYSRGRITVLDRKGIEQRACECYRVVKAEYDRLLPLAT